MPEISYRKRGKRDSCEWIEWESIPPGIRLLLIEASKITMGIKKIGDERFCKERVWLFSSGYELYDIPYEMLYPDEDKETEIIGQEELDFKQL
jgi:hypothetical protein